MRRRGVTSAGRPSTPAAWRSGCVPYGVASKQVRISAETTLKGYARADYPDAWERYLGPSHHGSETSETSETTETPAAPVSDVSDVSDAMGGEPMADEEVF